MQIMIDIDEDAYNTLKSYTGNLTYSEYLIKNGTPQPKMGHWIRQKSPYGDTYTYECSECGRTIYAEDGDLSDFPYCHCGAKMTESEE